MKYDTTMLIDFKSRVKMKVSPQYITPILSTIETTLNHLQSTSYCYRV